MPKPPLLLIPGTLNTARIWSAQSTGLAPLAEIHIADITTQDSTAAMAEDALRAMPPRFALAGFSLGGYVALEIMRRAPARVTGLALISTSARPEAQEALAGRQKSIELARRDFTRLLATMRPFMLAPANLDNLPLNAALDAMMLEVGAEAFARQSQAVMGRADSRALLPTITCPTLLVCGRDDKVTPPRLSEEMAAAVPGAVLELLDQVGHLAPIEAPDRLTHLMTTWLKRLELPQ
jgi:pimeloyl-ACP methyl ester carboxylesterase